MGGSPSVNHKKRCAPRHDQQLVSIEVSRVVKAMSLTSALIRLISEITGGRAAPDCMRPFDRRIVFTAARLSTAEKACTAVRFLAPPDAAANFLGAPKK